MWNTPIGDRVLEGLERSFYLELMSFSIEQLTSFYQAGALRHVTITGDRIFDSATFEQRIILIRDVLSALLDPKIEAPKHNNVNEAAAYFPFAMLYEMVEEEVKADIDGDFYESYRYYWRDFNWVVFKEYCYPELKESHQLNDPDAEPLSLDPHSNDLELSTDIINALEDRIFHDRDWKDSYNYPQLLDGVETRIEEIMDYNNYFTTRLPKPTKAEVKKAIAYIKKLK